MADKDNGTDSAKHFVHIDFTDDHSIEGMAVTLRGITPLQIHAAIWYMTRAANRLADMDEFSRDAKATANAAEAIEIARDIADPRIRKIGGSH